MKKGLTLIELLVIIAVIGVLTSIALSIFSSNNDEKNLTEKEYCLKYYSDSIQKDVPAKCLKYFITTGTVKATDESISNSSTAKFSDCSKASTETFRQMCLNTCNNIPSEAPRDAYYGCRDSCQQQSNKSPRDLCEGN